MKTIKISVVMGLFMSIFLLSGCAKNEAYRIFSSVEDCKNITRKCGKTIIEQHHGYDLTFIEFTERGNLFSRDKFDQVMNYINDLTEKSGVAVFVYIHGWKHNAKADDTNISDFKILLKRFSENQLLEDRKVVGVYIGWRGQTLSVPGVEQLTFWDRKSVAEEIGAGGMTAVLSRLNRILIAQYNAQLKSVIESKNTFTVMGHSMGAAILLSALHDVFVNSLVDSQNGSGSSCNKTKRFADGVILLNPAIEANSAVQIKELASLCEYDREQPKLMHVISSRADFANRVLFPIGQWLDLELTWDQRSDLKRTIMGKDIVLNEHELDLTTVGNIEQFRTNFLFYEDQQWKNNLCENDLEKCGITDPEKMRNHIPVNGHHPLSFTLTDKTFIDDHNDVFNCKVQSYIATIMIETQSAAELKLLVDNDLSKSSNKSHLKRCRLTNFDFDECFRGQLDEFNNNYSCQQNSGDSSS